MVRMRFEPVTSPFFLMIIIYFLSWLKIHKDINFLKSHDQTKFFLILKTNNEKRKNWKKKRFGLWKDLCPVAIAECLAIV